MKKPLKLSILMRTLIDEVHIDCIDRESGQQDKVCNDIILYVWK